MSGLQQIIRRAAEQDRGQLLTMMEAYIVDFYGAQHPGAERLEGLFSRLQEGQIGTQLVVEKGEQIVGFATLYFSWSTLRARPVLVLNDLYLAEEARGTGAASELFEACRAYGRENGYAAMSWETAKDNARAQAFYAKMGGVPGTWVNYSVEL
jgi:GNAT superfamily N-acetyltransferase